MSEGDYFNPKATYFGFCGTVLLFGTGISQNIFFDCFKLLLLNLMKMEDTINTCLCQLYVTVYVNIGQKYYPCRLGDYLMHGYFHLHIKCVFSLKYLFAYFTSVSIFFLFMLSCKDDRSSEVLILNLKTTSKTKIFV